MSMQLQLSFSMIYFVDQPGYQVFTEMFPDIRCCDALIILTLCGGFGRLLLMGRDLAVS